ncbi:MAG: hypothetical protein HQ472_06550 [Ignavibacteria bacterium]|nr:hypothetical protein [Ignavibacteria bacterium]
MILEQLISKYLDSELTPGEDSELRGKISADPISKQIFDDSVLMHIGLRFDTDQPVVSPELRSSVLDAIDNTIDADSVPKFTLPTTSGLGGIRKRSSAMLTLAVVFLVLCLPTTDQYIGQLYTTDLKTSTPVATTQTATLAPQPATSGDSKTRNSRVFLVNTMNKQETANATLADNAGATPAENTNAATPAAALEKSNASTSANSLRSSALSNMLDDEAVQTNTKPVTPNIISAEIGFRAMFSDANNFGKGLSSPILAKRSSMSDNGEGGDQVSRVVASTTYGMGYGAVPGITNVTQVAQSIAYSFSDDGYIGLEVGATSYTMSRTAIIRVSAPSTTSLVRVHSDKSKLTDIAEPVPSYKNEESNQITRESVVWGAAFVDKTLMSIKNLDFNGRAAVGAGEDGLMTYGRASASLKLFPSIALTIGAEARLMPYRMGPNVTAASSATSYGFSLNAISGIHIQF